jgi:hypothetical protein
VIDPISILVIGVSMLAVCGGGVWIGRKAGPRGDTQRENRKLKRDLKQAQAELETQEQLVETRTEALALAIEQRDAYRQSAETHTVKYPDVPGPVQTHSVWKKKRYSGLPDANLDALAKDLAAFEGRELYLDVKFQGRGGWKKIISDHWYVHKKNQYGNWVREYTTYIGNIHFEGPPARVIDEIRAFLHDDDTKLVRKQTPANSDAANRLVKSLRARLAGESLPPDDSPAKPSKPEKVWKDADSPLVFEITLAVSDPVVPPEMPDVHVVEVLKVEERIVEKVIRQPVVVSTDGEHAELSSDAKQEIIGLIDAVLDLRDSPTGRDEFVEIAAEEDHPAVG